MWKRALLLLSAVACNSTDDIELEDTGVDAMMPGKDASLDVAKMDATIDATKMDATTEASTDAGVDVTADASMDVAPDVSKSDAGTLVSGLVGLWNFEEKQAGTAPNNTDFADQSGSGGHATAKGQVKFGSGGKLGDAVGLDGTSAYATVPDSNALHPANFTVSAWFNLAKLPQNGGFTVASKPQKAAPWTSPYLSWMIRINSSTFIEAAVGSANTYCGGANVQAMSINTWYNVVLTYDGTTAKIYLNGNSVGSCNLNAAVAYAAQPIVIGADHGSQPVADYFLGAIDQLAIWNRVLTSNELAGIYNSGAGTPLP